MKISRSASIRIISCVSLAVVVLAGLLIWRFGFSENSVDPATTYQQALTAIRNDDLRAVRPKIFRLRFIAGWESQVDFLQGMLDLKTGNFRDAARELASAAKSEDLRPEAMPLLGEACYHLGQHSDAQRVLLDVLARDPEHTNARRWLAASFYDIGAMDLAMEQLEILSAKLPADGRALRLRALIQKDFERYSEAADDYTESLRRDPSAPDRQEMLLELAECQVRLYRYEQALNTLSDCKKSSASMVMMAECQQALNQPDAAGASLAEALKLDPRNVDGLLLQARFLLDENQVEEASKVLRQAVEISPQEYEARYQLSNVLRQQGKADEAEKETAEVQRLQALREEFTKLHETAFQDTQSAEIRFRLGQIADQLGKPDLAKTWFQAALALNPSHSAAAQELQKRSGPQTMQN